MKNTTRVKSVTTTLLSLALSVGSLAISASLPVQAQSSSSKNFTQPAMVEMAGTEDEMNQLLSVQAGADQYWAHGNTMTLEPLIAGTSMKHFGFGSEIQVTSAADGAGFAWVHLSIPTPRMVEGTTAKLSRVFVSYSGDAAIDKIDVWDAAITRLISAPVFWTGAGVGVVTLPTPLAFSSGIGVSLHVAARCTTDFCGTEKMLVRTAGAEFTR